MGGTRLYPWGAALTSDGDRAGAGRSLQTVPIAAGQQSHSGRRVGPGLIS